MTGHCRSTTPRSPRWLRIAAAGAALLSGATTLAAGELNVLNWQGYGTDEAWALEMFEKRTGVKVAHDHFNSEQEMLTKLRTSPGAYDVVLINSAFTCDAANEKLIEPIDGNQITNFKDLSPNMRDSDLLNCGGQLHGVAWVWGITSFAYNTEKIPNEPTSIQALWDERFAGKVGWRDDPVESVSFAAIALGQDPNNPSDLDAVREKLLALKSQVRTFWSSEDEWNKHMAAGQFDIATYWSGSASRSKTAFKLPVKFVVPEEGAIGWFDGLSIATNAPNREAAHAFIDFMINPEFYVKWDTEVGAPASANAAANAQLPEDAFNRTVMGNASMVDRLHFMAQLSDEKRQELVDLWEEVKTELAQ
ncbi:MAG: ABC transporter substrate-binding protein [Gammaproteobacteria bacterium]